MALNYKSVSEDQTVIQANSDEENFNIVEKKQELSSRLKGSKEVDDIVSAMDVNNPQSLVLFGNETAQQMSKCSDEILRSVEMNSLNESSALLNSLTKIMDKFDIKEIGSEQSKGFLAKFFGNAKKQIEQLLQKYNTMGDEVDKIYVELQKYSSEITESNKKLDTMFYTNVQYYQDLMKYILAGDQASEELDKIIADMQEKYNANPDNMTQLDISNLQQAKQIIDQRTHDLKIAENVAMQSLPMIKSMYMSNIFLLRKINSAFIITMPIFKQSLTQAILLKRQMLQAESMQALDDKTNEMLLKNAQNTALQTKLTAQLSSNSSVKIETLEQTWKTIVQGIEDTKKIQEDAKVKREEDSKRLQQIKDDFKLRFPNSGLQ